MDQSWIFRIAVTLIVVCATQATGARNDLRSLVTRLFAVGETTVGKISGQSVPPPPTQRADRFGIYNWNVNDAPFPNDGTSDRLNWGADKVAEMGSRTIRVAISTRDDYFVNPPGAVDLTQIAKCAAYDKLFKDPRFQTYLLTAYTRGDMASNWSDGYTASEYAAEREEIKKFGEYLLSNPAFANKTFILLNWEGDNAIGGVANKRSGWDHYVNWIRARAEGVKLARQSVSTSAAHLFSGLEYSAVGRNGKPCGSIVDDPAREDPFKYRCVIDYVAPQVEVDYYSYSSWQSILDKQDFPNENLKQRYKTDLNFALSKVKVARPEIVEQNFIIGEYGFERSRYGECNAANHLNEMFDAFDGEDAFHVSYAIFWQIIDNARLYGLLDERFGLFRVSDGQLAPTLLSGAFKKRMEGKPATNYTGCPRIRRWPEPPGVLNQMGGTDFTLDPDSAISIYAPNCCQDVDSPFSASGNTVHFDQLVQNFKLPRKSSSLWYESPSQINFSMPEGRRAGGAWIYVTDARGIDSNAQTITLTCADCPQINGSCGVVNTVDPVEPITPGATITINGAGFSPTGNIVVLEFLQSGQVNASRPLPRENILLESPTQINLKLPEDLPLTYQAILYVVNAQGLQTKEVVFGISGPCQDCSPQFRPCRAIVNKDGGGFLAGNVTTAFGRFSPVGNKVVIEQVDRQFNVHQYTLAQGSPKWSEDSGHVQFVLPDTLFPGHAALYLVDAQGRETSAREIIINATLLRNVSAANYQGPNLSAESIATAFGQSMASTTQVASSNPLPTEMSGTRVIVKDNTGVERPAPLFFISPTQINYQIPPGTQLGSAAITVVNSSGMSSTDSVQIMSVTPGIFSANATGAGVAAALVYRLKSDGAHEYEPVASFDQSQNKFVSVPINLDSLSDQVYLILFGTGIRGRSALSAVKASIGGSDVEINYAGPQGVLVGVDQINLHLPTNLIGKEEVDVTIVVDGVPANPVKVRIK
jgi:uncharacterized protein (TIGR03437 family)